MAATLKSTRPAITAERVCFNRTYIFFQSPACSKAKAAL
jgi:hypothetical protein